MKERPILFSGPMVKAILEGRKTQTRRVVKPVFGPFGFQITPDEIAKEIVGNTESVHCPYGQPGDRLWVRETWGACAGGVVFRSDDGTACPDGGKWRPSIFMPRWASRINLEIISVRVDRLNEISEEDAIAEGCDETSMEHTEDCDNDDCVIAGGIDDCCGYLVSAKLRYKTLWESINGPGSWERNDWVWVVEFKEVKP